MTDLETILAATRYEKIRKLSAGEYSRIWNDCLANEIHFDDAIDALPEPFRTKMKEEPRICQTCKHWGELDTVRISDGKCEKIYQNIHIPNEVQWRKREWLLTNANFGCNRHQQIDNF